MPPGVPAQCSMQPIVCCNNPLDDTTHGQAVNVISSLQSLRHVTNQAMTACRHQGGSRRRECPTPWYLHQGDIAATAGTHLHTRHTTPGRVTREKAQQPHTTNTLRGDVPRSVVIQLSLHRFLQHHLGGSTTLVVWLQAHDSSAASRQKH